MQSERQIVSVLGGPKSLGREVKSIIDFDALIKKGFSWKIALHVKEVLTLSDREFARTIGISERTVSRKKKVAGRLSLVESDRLYRIAKMFALAKSVFENSDRAKSWLRRPQFGLGGRIPFDIINTEAGAEEVEDLLLRIEYGSIA